MSPKEVLKSFFSVRERKTYFFIRNVAARAALLSGIAKQGGESTQAKIIVVLFRQLLHCQGVQGEHLLSQELQGQRHIGAWVVCVVCLWSLHGARRLKQSVNFH